MHGRFQCPDQGLESFGSYLECPSQFVEHADYFSANYFPKAGRTDVENLLSLYPVDPTDGSPFNTSTQFAITSQYQRIAALIGNLAFHGTRRFFMGKISDRQSSWSYVFKRFKAIGNVLGAWHGSDLNTINGPGDLTGLPCHLHQSIITLTQMEPPSHPGRSMTQRASRLSCFSMTLLLVHSLQQRLWQKMSIYTFSTLISYGQSSLSIFITMLHPIVYGMTILLPMQCVAHINILHRTPEPRLLQSHSKSCF
ncbi:hypothetical protein K474DRAFT_1189478 [Panus rudis PR-1116 ss-1]|nr:hypothetical protein K474DRAFT_1189478 [Panus rudis PR-1116 ss-1]